MPRAASRNDLKDIRDYSDMRCPLHGFISLLSGPWTVYILWVLHSNGPMRFGQIKKEMPKISAKVLTERLRMLEEAGVLDRAQETTIPPRVTYSFTSRGQELHAMLDQINDIARSWAADKPRIVRK